MGRPEHRHPPGSQRKAELEAKAAGRCWPEGRRRGRRVTWEGGGQVDFK